MATRLKTVRYAFPITTSLVPDLTLTNLSQITLHVPESSPTFTSVFAELSFSDITTAGGSTISEYRCGLKLGSAAYSTYTETRDITSTGENISCVVSPINFTDYFNANWSGTSMTLDAQVYFNQISGTTYGMANVCVIVYLTYEYDDTDSTQIKTLEFGLDSSYADLPTSAANLGTNQIPQLTGSGGELAESSPVIRDYYFIIEGNDNCVAATDFTLSVNIDGGTTTTFMPEEAQLGSMRYKRWVYKPSSIPDTTTAHNIQMWSSLAGRMYHLSVSLFVTYEFDASTTTRVTNQVQIPVDISSPVGVTTSAEASRFAREFVVSELGTIEMKQSFLRMNWNCNNTPAFIWIRCGNQAYSGTQTSASVVCGMFCLQRRLDDGGDNGAAFTLDRGINNIVIDVFSTNAANQMTNVSGYVTLTYVSDVGSEGIGQNSNTVYHVATPWDGFVTDRLRIENYSVQIPEANYWLVSAGFVFTMLFAASSNAIMFDAECLAGEGKGGGYYGFYADAYQSDNERSCSQSWMQGRDTFKRFPLDAGADRLDIETARDYRLFTTTISAGGMYSVVTYHSLTWNITGNFEGADFDSGLDTVVELVRYDTGETIQTKTIAAGTTSYDFITYDDTLPYQVIGTNGTSRAVSAVGCAS